MKTFGFKIDPLTGEDYYEVYVRGRQLLNDSLLNKASAFKKEERLSLGIDGMLRSGISKLDSQVNRAYEAYQRKSDDLERYIYLGGLQDRNETLFYRLLIEHLEEMVPIVYTPTVGQACMQMSHIQRRYRGLYITPDNIANIDQMFQGLSQPQVNLIVVTDGERILGLGDLGSDGMGISIGKVSLYVAIGGVHPAVCLPICLDDPLYLGIRRPRMRGAEYEEMVEKFILGVKRNFPSALLQWEDFAKQTAFTNLDRYKERILSFNDDIQGTGSTALGALMTAMRIKKSRFQDESYVIVGMGQAGTGIAMNIRAMLKIEGLSDEEARRRIFAVDMQGLLIEGDPLLEGPQEPLAHRRAGPGGHRQPLRAHELEWEDPAGLPVQQHVRLPGGGARCPRVQGLPGDQRHVPRGQQGHQCLRDARTGGPGTAAAGNEGHPAGVCRGGQGCGPRRPRCGPGPAAGRRPDRGHRDQGPVVPQVRFLSAGNSTTGRLTHSFCP